MNRSGVVDAPSLIIPSAVPWDNVKQDTLEGFLYWLLDEQGFKNLTWRRGGTTTTSPDGGRDLEATRYVETLMGDLEPQTWWIEAKGRSGTVEKHAVQEAVLNAAGTSSVDVLVLATNTQFSNPTFDWVAQWQLDHPRPKVWLWQRENLERLASTHPSAVARMFSDALSPQGRLEFARGRFWNHGMYASSEDLRSFWRHRGDLHWTPDSILAVVASESANGNPEVHPWCIIISEAAMPEVVTNAFRNADSLFERAEQFGANTQALFDGIGYILLASLRTLRAAATIDCIRDVWKASGDGRPTSELFRERIEKELVAPIINDVRDVLCDACADNCERVQVERNRLSDEQVAAFWKRFVYSPRQPDAEAGVKVRVTSERRFAPCRAGLPLNTQRGCPLLHHRNDFEEDMNLFVHIVDRLVRRS